MMLRSRRNAAALVLACCASLLASAQGVVLPGLEFSDHGGAVVKAHHQLATLHLEGRRTVPGVVVSARIAWERERGPGIGGARPCSLGFGGLGIGNLLVPDLLVGGDPVHMLPVSPLADFSYDYQDLWFTPTAAKNP